MGESSYLTLTEPMPNRMTCPSLAITTLAGSGMIGPAAPLVALLTGALLGGVAGGTAGGVYTCKVVLINNDGGFMKYLDDKYSADVIKIAS